jgi:hypothetical protein
MRSRFLTGLSAAIRMGTEGPPVLQQMLWEQEMWQRFGLTRETAGKRPHLELADYQKCIVMIRREEAAQASRRPR